MKPLIKWPGGKAGEYKYIKHIVPEFNKFIEPFFGGGAIYFKLEPNKATINDINLDLVNFYKCTQKQSKPFLQQLNFFADEWEKISALVDANTESIIEAYKNQDKSDTKNTIEIIMYQILFDKYKFSKRYFDTENLKKQIIKNLKSKVQRTKKITNKDTNDDDIINNIESAVKSGIYMHFRDIYNKKVGKLSIEEAAAVFFFIREFCYASMFRYNKKGEFNIPYGGIGYNRKNFRAKTQAIQDSEISKQLNKTEILNTDFENVIRKSAKKNDFIFLDPPYDSEFKDYDKNPFTKEDQARLADCLSDTEAKFILIIKQTDFIDKLYANRGFKVESFEKKYLYNMRGRNNRDVNHLLIYNY
ncbi:MAG: DNA adenine methylase [Micrococcaceae bacterium]